MIVIRVTSCFTVREMRETLALRDRVYTFILRARKPRGNNSRSLVQSRHAREKRFLHLVRMARQEIRARTNTDRDWIASMNSSVR